MWTNGSVRPCRLVGVEGVLLHRPVEVHEALLVPPGHAAFLAPVRGEVGQVPHVRRPQPGPGLDHLDHVLVVLRLELLGVVAAYRCARLDAGSWHRRRTRTARSPHPDAARGNRRARCRCRPRRRRTNRSTGCTTTRRAPSRVVGRSRAGTGGPSPSAVSGRAGGPARSVRCARRARPVPLPVTVISFDRPQHTMLA